MRQAPHAPSCWMIDPSHSAARVASWLRRSSTSCQPETTPIFRYANSRREKRRRLRARPGTLLSEVKDPFGRSRAPARNSGYDDTSPSKKLSNAQEVLETGAASRRLLRFCRDG